MSAAEAGAVREAALCCRAIEKRFLSNGRLDPDRPVLAGVDLDVPPGSLTAVLGPSVASTGAIACGSMWTA